MAQRLVRTLCPHCKREGAVQARGGAQALEHAVRALQGARRPSEVYRPVGCLECRNTGYLGRIGIYEIMQITREIKPLINEHTDLVAAHAGRLQGRHAAAARLRRDQGRPGRHHLRGSAQVRSLALRAVVVALLALGARGLGGVDLRLQVPAAARRAGARRRDSSAAVEVVRDSEGVPHLFARSERDGWFAMGYVHAQDRLWQMEFQRRVAQGRLAEILGERALRRRSPHAHPGHRAHGRRASSSAWMRTRAPTLEAYAAGVNAFLASDPVLPVEFQALRIRPRAVDARRHDGLAARDGVGPVAQLAHGARAPALRREARAASAPASSCRPTRATSRAPLPDFGKLYAAAAPAVDALLAAYPPHGRIDRLQQLGGRRERTPRPASRCSPTIRTSGLQAPSLWYLAHLSSPAGNVVGGHAARRAVRGARPQRRSRVVDDDDQRRHAGPLRRARGARAIPRATSRPAARRSSRCARR